MRLVVSRSVRAGILSLVVLAAASQARAQAGDPSDYDIAVPTALRGPFVSDPAVVTLLDCMGTACPYSLDFSKLILARVPAPGEPVQDNPFKLSVLNNGTVKGNVKEKSVLQIVEDDLAALQKAEAKPDGSDR